jgi:hypothetical protein
MISPLLANIYLHDVLDERLGLKEQQIQRYEAKNYETASLKRVIEIARALAA